jgi:hypothetical protein
LNNYCLSDNLMSVSRLFFAFTVLLTYPLECFVAREVISNVFLGRNRFTTDQDSITVGLELGIGSSANSVPPVPPVVFFYMLVWLEQRKKKTNTRNFCE